MAYESDYIMHNPQDDLPYEVRMKYIIQDYRRMIERVETISNYAKKLEKENKELAETISIKKLKHQITYRKLVDVRRENKALKKHNLMLQKQLRNLEQ